jgi:hypothetical protein
VNESSTPPHAIISDIDSGEAGLITDPIDYHQMIADGVDLSAEGIRPTSTKLLAERLRTL